MIEKESTEGGEREREERESVLNEVNHVSPQGDRQHTHHLPLM